MNLLTTASAVRGLPVVTIAGGEDVAEIRDIIYDAKAGRVAGFTLNKRGRLSGRRREVLPAAQVHAIGRDAVMVRDEDALVDADAAPVEVGAPDRDRDVIGNDVVTEGGVSLGRITDVVLLVGGTGEVVGYQLERPGGGEGYIPLPAQLAVSGAVLVVPNTTEEFVRDDLVGLGAAVDEFRTKLDLS
ncbi:MAG: PRC-barrel domain-containing protein [Solirubrobacteraceae bacterium]